MMPNTDNSNLPLGFGIGVSSLLCLYGIYLCYRRYCRRGEQNQVIAIQQNLEPSTRVAPDVQQGETSSLNNRPSLLPSYRAQQTSENASPDHTPSMSVVRVTAEP